MKGERVAFASYIPSPDQPGGAPLLWRSVAAGLSHLVVAQLAEDQGGGSSLRQTAQYFLFPTQYSKHIFKARSCSLSHVVFITAEACKSEAGGSGWRRLLFLLLLQSWYVPEYRRSGKSPHSKDGSDLWYWQTHIFSCKKEANEEIWQVSTGNWS